MINIYLIGNKGYTALKNLKKGHLSVISCVIIGQDKNVQNDYSINIENFCIEKNLNYVIQNETYQVTSQFSIAIGWRRLINDDSKVIVFHDSLLPKYRGFNPLVTALLNGDKKIGVTALKASNEYDRGEIIKQESIQITYPIKIKKAIEKISIVYANLLVNIVNKIVSNNLTFSPQDEAKATYSLWRDSENYKIDWTTEADNIKRFVDAVGYPYKGAYTYINGKKIIIKNVEVTNDVEISNREPGKVIFKNNASFVIVCGKGLLKINKFYNEKGEEVKFNNFRLRFK